jgi:hypothetical protein
MRDDNEAELQDAGAPQAGDDADKDDNEEDDNDDKDNDDNEDDDDGDDDDDDDNNDDKGARGERRLTDEVKSKPNNALPLARVKRIIKLDDDVHLLSNSAAILITKATVRSMSWCSTLNFLLFQHITILRV